jgi:hypothetical protein
VPAVKTEIAAAVEKTAHESLHVLAQQVGHFRIALPIAGAVRGFRIMRAPGQAIIGVVVNRVQPVERIAQHREGKIPRPLADLLRTEHAEAQFDIAQMIGIDPEQLALALVEQDAVALIRRLRRKQMHRLVILEPVFPPHLPDQLPRQHAPRGARQRVENQHCAARSSMRRINLPVPSVRKTSKLEFFS